MEYLSTFLFACLFGALSLAYVWAASKKSPQGMGRREYIRRHFWMVSFPLFIGFIALLALSALQGMEAAIK